MAHLRYLRYVLVHKWWVLVAGLRVWPVYGRDWREAPAWFAYLWRLLIHDWSKFLPGEWGPYVANFYGRSPAAMADDWFEQRLSELRPAYGFAVPERIRNGLEAQAQRREKQIREERKSAYDRAWLHHQHFNAHHWQHWVLRLDDGPVRFLEMPVSLVREMVADWMGAGRAINGKWEVAEWYRESREKIKLDQNTRALVERLIERVSG